MTMSSQTFFPGHEDIDKSHSGSLDGTHCTKCKMDLRGRGDLLIAQDDTEQHWKLRRANYLKDRMKKETNPMTQANLLRALKQLYPGGPSTAPSVPSAIAQARQMRPMRPTQEISIPFDVRLEGNQMQDVVRQQQMMREQVMRLKSEAADQAMAQDVAQKMGALTPGQRQAARRNAEKAIAIALFHTDPRIHAHLLLDPMNDEPDHQNEAMTNLWNTDAMKWRTQAIERASKMIAIMDGLGKASL